MSPSLPRPRSAFTLIEVMVVLSILAITAVLAYNYFGGTMREASVTQRAARVYNDLRVLSAAMERYAMDNGGAWPPRQADGMAALVDGGYLKGALTPDPDTTTAGTDTYDVYPDWDDIGGPSAATDDVVEIYGVEPEVCIEFARRYSAVGVPFVYGTPQYPAVVEAAWCEDWDGSGAGVFRYSIVMTVHLN